MKSIYEVVDIIRNQVEEKIWIDESEGILEFKIMRERQLR